MLLLVGLLAPFVMSSPEESRLAAFMELTQDVEADNAKSDDETNEDEVSETEGFDEEEVGENEDGEEDSLVEVDADAGDNDDVDDLDDLDDEDDDLDDFVDDMSLAEMDQDSLEDEEPSTDAADE